MVAGKNVLIFVVAVVVIILGLALYWSGKKKYYVKDISEIVITSNYQRSTRDDGGVWMYAEDTTNEEYFSCVRVYKSGGWVEQYYSPVTFRAYSKDRKWKLYIDNIDDFPKSISIVIVRNEEG